MTKEKNRIDSGHSISAYLEGDWRRHWHHTHVMPKGRVLCAIDTQGDIVQARKDLEGYPCIAGGVQDSMLILGASDQVRNHARSLYRTLRQDRSLEAPQDAYALGSQESGMENITGDENLIKIVFCVENDAILDAVHYQSTKNGA
jgi:hypothetical protein